MTKLEHVYKPIWFMRGFTILFDVAGIFLPILVFVLPFTIADDYRPWITFEGILILLLIAAVGSISLLSAANLYTEIISDREGLHIRFLWKHLLVRWDEIVDLKPLYNLSILRNEFVIRTHSLTPFHRLYGLSYSFTFLPCIVFSKNISNYHELSKRIRESSRKAKMKS